MLNSILLMLIRLLWKLGWDVVQILILQSAFFALNPQILPIDKAVEYMKEMAKKSYSKKGDAIVQLNYKAIDAGKDAIEEVTVDPKWADSRNPRN